VYVVFIPHILIRCNFSSLNVFGVCHHLHPCMLPGALQLDGARPQPRAAASAAAIAITALQQQPLVLEPAAVTRHPSAPSSISVAAALEAVSDLAMALSGEADAAHAAATAAVVPLLRLAEPAVAAAIKQGLKLLYAAAREGASVPADVLQTVRVNLPG
jgi:hypothetical protein